MAYKWLFVFIWVFSCSKNQNTSIIEFKNPASKIGSESNLHISKDGTIYLSWIEANELQASKLWFSILNEETLTWQEPRLIAQGTDWFVNWADFPSITSFGKTNLAAHYLDKSADDTYAYDVKLTLSNDNGKTWSTTTVPHRDSTATEHGFVSKLALKDNKLLNVWLDGRQYAYAAKDSLITKEMTLRSAILDASGKIHNESLLDSRVCDCCQTDACMTSRGPFVVYRDRSESEIRDIYYVRQIEGKWTDPKPLYNDNWKIAGCPVNGPAISSKEETVAVTWFTIADAIPKIKIIFSEDSGDTFGKPMLIDHIKPLGRVDIELLNPNTALVSWMNTVEGETAIQLQCISKDGKKSDIITVSETSDSRSSGFPRLIVKAKKAYISWTEVGDTLKVKTSAINLTKLNK